MSPFSSSMEFALQFFSDNPTVFAVQITMVVLAFLVVFLVLFATRDIMMRTNSFIIQILCIILVACLPVLGFLLYLLVRPSRTLSEKRLQADMEHLLKKLSHSQNPKKHGLHEQNMKGKKHS